MDPILARNLERYGITVHRPRPRRARRLRQGRPPGPGSHRSPRRRPAPRAPEGAPRRVSPPFAFRETRSEPARGVPRIGSRLERRFRGPPCRGDAREPTSDGPGARGTRARRLGARPARPGRVPSAFERASRAGGRSASRFGGLPRRGIGFRAVHRRLPGRGTPLGPVGSRLPRARPARSGSAGDSRAPDPREAGRQATPARSISLCAFASLRESSFESSRKDAKGAREERYGRPPSAATRPKAFG